MQENMSTYVFIDGAYLRRQHTNALRDWFGCEPEIDFRSVIQGLDALCGPPVPWLPVEYVGSVNDRPELRSFYYDCLPEGRPDEIAFRTLLENIREVSGCHIRLGTLKGNKPRQKEVDVLLVVDMMAHAARKNMDKAVLVAGDQDFRPAVEALVQLGVFVQLVGVDRTTSKELTWAASSYTKLTFDNLFEWTCSSQKSRQPKPRVYNYQPNLRDRKLIKNGRVNGNHCSLFQSESGFDIYFERLDSSLNDYQGWSELDLQHEDLDRLELFIQLSFGELTWDD